MAETLDKLAAVLEERKTRKAGDSYVADLYLQGRDAILKKLGEEAAELIIAAKNPDKKAIIHEMADLWFHSLVLLADLGLRPAEILAELDRRFGESGLKEKINRGKSV
jgi:phosphoribosyl-ATP pyrophosphohydrolase